MAVFNSSVAANWKLIALGSLVFVWILSSLQLHDGQVTFRNALNQAHLDQSAVDTAPSVSALLDVAPLEDEETFEETESIPIHDELRPLIIYTYAESPNARANFEYFVAKGVHGAADFIFVFNGETNATELVPSESNIKILRRENKCFDLGTIGEVLMKNDLWKKYKRFITLNASIRGPFLPTYASSSCWSDVFLNRITEEVKLVGTTFNCQPRPHLQSMLFATDDVGMGILLDPVLAKSASIDDFWGTKDDPVGFTQCYETLYLAVHSEVGITELIRSQGYEVDSLMTAFQAATPATYCEKNGFPEDILYDRKYYGANIHPYETVFIKANRNIDTTLLEDMTKWHLEQPTSSWQTCHS
ncbi:hypothetical protein N431DRAFT_465921 [Stipitochalara longipes BDJ]|nr:hypothetical protein N431DRAFT_465921 [Stipitochalara longipes BDJ]